jgi:hypothetical protein
MMVGMALLAGSAGAADRPALTDEKGRRSYALGMAVGKQLRSQAVEVDPDLHRQGLEDALSGGKTLLTESEARGAVQRLQAELKQLKIARQREELRSSAAARGLQVSFQLDPRVTKGAYMGDRWVSRATYASASAPEVGAITVKARARGADASTAGEPGPAWIASDPGMVAISPSQGGEVTLTVQRSGQSTVTVKYRDLSSTFKVETAAAGGRWRVDLSSLPEAPLPAGATAVAAPNTVGLGQ